MIEVYQNTKECLVEWFKESIITVRYHNYRLNLDKIEMYVNFVLAVDLKVVDVCCMHVNICIVLYMLLPSL